jgi:hypothetical protein
MARRPPHRERRKKQLGEIIHYETEKQHVMVTPEEFAKIIGKPGMVCYNTEDGKLAFKIGRDKEILVRHYGKKAVVFEDRRRQISGAGARVVPSVPRRSSAASLRASIKKDLRRLQREQDLPAGVAERIRDSLQASGKKKE